MRAVRWACVVGLIAVVPYAGSLDSGFHYDDFHSIVYNPHIRSLDEWPTFFTDARTFSEDPQQAMYRPVLVLSYALNHAVSGGGATGYRVVNLLLHGFNAALLLLLCRGLRWRAGMVLLTALWFALTPLNAEAVLYVSARSDLLMGTLVLCACLAYRRCSDGVGRQVGAPAAASAAAVPGRFGGPGQVDAGTPETTSGVVANDARLHPSGLAAHAVGLHPSGVAAHAASLPPSGVTATETGARNNEAADPQVSGRMAGSRLAAWALVALLCGTAALLTKSTAAVLPAVLLATDAARGGWALVRRRWAAYGIGLCLVLAYVGVSRSLVLGALSSPVRPLTRQAGSQALAWVYQALLAAMPVGLTVEHQFHAAPGVWSLRVIASLLVIGSALVAVARSRSLELRLAAVWAGLFVLPATVVPLIVLVSERRLYLSSVGWSMVAAWALLAVFSRRPRVAGGLAVAYTTILLGLTVQQVPVWADELSLWRHAVVQAPEMLKPHLRLGDALAVAGDEVGAERAYERALQVRPHHPVARNNLGRLYLQQGRWDEAEAQFHRVLDRHPELVPTRLNLASLLLRQGRWQEATGQFAQALEHDDTQGVAQRYLGLIALQHQADPAQAAALFAAALERGPPSAAVWRLRGVALRQLGKPEEARRAYREALRLQPEDADTWYNLGNLLVDLGQHQEAAAAYQRALSQAGDTPLGAVVRKLLAAMGGGG